MESYCKTIAPQGEESVCLGLFPRAGAQHAGRSQSVLRWGFGVGPRGPTVMNHLKDLIMLRSLDWGPTRDRRYPFFFSLTLHFLLMRAEFVVYIIKEKDQTLDILV